MASGDPTLTLDAGIPHYIAMERKPDNGGEIQNLADVASGIMLQLKIVKSAAEEEAIVLSVFSAWAIEK